MKRRNFLWYSTLLITGCTVANTNTGGDTTASGSAQMPTQLRFAVTDVSGLAELQEDYEELRVALAAALATEVVFVPVENQTAAIVGLKQGSIDLALAGPAEYVIIHSRTNAVPVIAITRPNYYSLIVVNTDSGIATVADLQGQSIAMSDIGSTSGHLGPTKLLIDAGLDPKTDIQVQMLGDEGSADAMKNRQVQAWGGSATDYQDLLQDASGKFQILAQSDPLPSDVLIASSIVDPAVVNLLRTNMLANQNALVTAIANQQSKYVGSELVAANDADYDSIREIYKVIGQGDFVQ